MANYDDFKKKAKDVVDTITDASVEAYKLAEEKARVFAKRAKLSAGIANERALIRRLKVEIGGTYYKLFKDSPDEALKLHCDDITFALERIAARQRELEELRNVTSFDEDEAEECDCCDCTEASDEEKPAE